MTTTAMLTPCLFITNGAERLTVDSTGIDVTGTVVSDGLTVENTGSASTLTLTKTDGSAFTASAGNYSILGTDDSTNLYFKTNGSFRQLISSNGDISFYSSDGLSQALSGMLRRSLWGLVRFLIKY